MGATITWGDVQMQDIFKALATPEPEREYVPDMTPCWLHLYNAEGRYMASDVFYGRTERAAAMRGLVSRCGLRVAGAQDIRARTRVIGETQWEITECEYRTLSGATHAFFGLIGTDARHEHYPATILDSLGRLPR